MPQTMRCMEMLGFEAGETQDHRWAEFAGHGIHLHIPSDAVLGVMDVMRLAVEAARAAGAEERCKALRKLLGVR